jgi:hypothetical protein
MVRTHVRMDQQILENLSIRSGGLKLCRPRRGKGYNRPDNALR